MERVKESKGQQQDYVEQAKKHAAGESGGQDREQKIKKGQEAQEAKREIKRMTDEPARLAREKERKEADLAREQKIRKEQVEREAKREAKRIADEPVWLAREQARKAADLARDKKIEEEQAARKRKAGY